MRIGIDVECLGETNWTGIGRYTFHLVDELVRLSGDEYRLYCPRGFWQKEPPILPAWPEATAHVSYRTPRLPWRYVRHLQRWLRFPAASHMLGNIQVFHATNHKSLPTGKVPLVMTIHDLTPQLFPQYHNAWIREVGKRLPALIRRARHLIAVSENTRRDLIEHMGVAPEQITVVPLAPSPRFHAPHSPSDLRIFQERLGLDRPYILFTGTLEPRKNVPRLLEAFARLPDEKTREVDLVIAGGKGWLFEEVFETVARLNLEKRVRFPGFIADEDLPLLMAGAHLFVYPSLYEGFGLPPLEAMASGVPVIVSDRSSLPEVVGDAGIQVDPTDPDAIAEAMQRLLDSDEEWQRYRSLGLERARAFSWERTARETLEVYRRVATAGAPYFP